MTDVLAFAFDDSAKVLAYTVVSRDSTKDGAFVRNLSNGVDDDAARRTTATTRAWCSTAPASQLAIRIRSRRIRPRRAAALHDLPGAGERRRRAGDRDAGAAARRTCTSPTPVRSRSRARAPPSRSTWRRRRLIRCRPTRSLAKAVFDLWHYKDQTLQPTQKLNAARDRNKSYSAIYFPATKTLDAPRRRRSADRRRVGGRTRRRRELAREVHDRADVGRRRHRRLLRRSHHRRAQADQGEDQRERAALAGREVHLLLRPRALVHVHDRDREAHRRHRRAQGRALRQRDRRSSGGAAGVGRRRLDEGRPVDAGLRSLRHLGDRSDGRAAAGRRHGLGRTQEARFSSGSPKAAVAAAVVVAADAAARRRAKIAA